MKLLRQIFKAALFILLLIPTIFYMLFFDRERVFYISGTGTTHEGERRFFKLTLTTNGNKVPIKEIENQIHEELGLEGCIVLFFTRIPMGMKKYVTEDYKCKIVVDGKEKTNIN